MADKNFSASEVFQQAMAQHQQGNFAQAEVLYRQILQQEPNHGDALHFLGVMAYQIGNYPAAVQLIRLAIQSAPSVAMYSNLALVFQAQGDIDSLIETYHQALRLENNPTLHFYLANTLAQKGELAAAVTSYQAALALNPDDAEIYNQLGNVFAQLNKVDEAIDCYQQVLKRRPDDGYAHNNLASLLKGQGKLSEAELSFRQALKALPDYARGYHNLAVALYEQGHFAQAIENYQKAIALEPHHESFYNLGCLFQKQKKWSEAADCFVQTLALKNDFYLAYHNYGVVLQAQDYFDEAMVQYQKALALNAKDPNVYSALAGTLVKKGEYQAGIAGFREGLKVETDNPTLHFNLGLSLLTVGNYDEGWRHAEYRYDASIKEYHYERPPVTFPQWHGEAIAGKSLLIWYEQGLGDEIQFCRYVSVLKQMGAKAITLACKKPLQPLFETLAGVDRLLAVDEKMTIQPHDYWVFPLSIPLYCKTTLNTIPAHSPYLAAVPERVKFWQNKLPQGKMRVGLVWKGSVGHANDANRSLSHLTDLLPLWGVPECAFVSLQKGQGEDEVGALPKNCSITHLGSQIQDFADTAAIVAQLDLVICVDTSIAHLAGALGKPVWLLVPFVPDWRWLLDREDTPWYPKMRLFRQKQPKQWQPVIAQVSEQLKSMITGSRFSPQNVFSDLSRK